MTEAFERRNRELTPARSGIDGSTILSARPRHTAQLVTLYRFVMERRRGGSVVAIDDDALEAIEARTVDRLEDADEIDPAEPGSQDEDSGAGTRNDVAGLDASRRDRRALGGHSLSLSFPGFSKDTAGLIIWRQTPLQMTPDL
jgi:hypothetical protein